MSGASTFEKVVLATIVANTGVVVWGLCDHSHEHLLDPLHNALTVFWVVELGVRRRAAGSWRRFFASRWNVFDTLVIALGLLPVLGVGVTLLRVARGARLVHSLRHVSHLRAVDFLRLRKRAAVQEMNTGQQAA